MVCLVNILLVELFIPSLTLLCNLYELWLFIHFFWSPWPVPSICFFPARFLIIFKLFNIFPFNSNIFFSLLLLRLFSFSSFYFLCPDHSLPMYFISLALLVITRMLQLTLPVLQSPSIFSLLLNAIFSSPLHPWHKRIWSSPAAFTSKIKKGGSEDGSKVPSEPGGGLGSASLCGQGPTRSDARIRCAGYDLRSCIPCLSLALAA